MVELDGKKYKVRVKIKTLERSFRVEDSDRSGKVNAVRRLGHRRRNGLHRRQKSGHPRTNARRPRRSDHLRNCRGGWSVHRRTRRRDRNRGRRWRGHVPAVHPWADRHP